MKLKNRPGPRPARLAAELHDDDGVDPRTAFSRIAPRDDRPNRKALQLCEEVSWALRVALACDAGDPLLSDLELVAVEPLRGASHLCVRLRLPETAAARSAAHRAEVLARIYAVGGFLRAQVAAAIRRRRAPELHFVVLPPDGGHA